MRLAIIVDDYLPNSTRVGAKMMHELALEFTNQGHQPIVITPHFNKDKSRFIKDFYENIEVWRFYSGQIKDIAYFKRAINESLLSSNAWNAIKKNIYVDTFDGIIYYSPSIFFGSLVAKIKKKCNCTSYLVLRDFFPQWVVDSGYIKSGSVIERYFRLFEKHSYDQADTIGVMSEANKDIFNKQNKNKFRVNILRNWTSPKINESITSKIDIREHLGLTKEIIFFYGGNIGHAQDVSSLLYLAKSMQIYKDAYFLFIGQGDEVRKINNLAKKLNLNNFTYMPSVNQNEFKEILKQIDIGLFSLSNKHTSHNFPGKLLGYMKESKPILGCVNNGNDLTELINNSGAGFVSNNGDDKTLFQNAYNLYKHKNIRKISGKLAYELLEEEFLVSIAVKSIISSLKG